MEWIFTILIVASFLLGSVLAIYGIYGLIKGETYIINQRASEVHKLSGPVARQYSLYYFLGGCIWVAYALLRFLNG